VAKMAINHRFFNGHKNVTSKEKLCVCGITFTYTFFLLGNLLPVTSQI